MDPTQRHIRPEELLAQLRWVRALARSLVLDAETADDVLQRVCLLAIQKPPSRAHSGAALRAWLASVTRNLARRKVRTDSRRARRERLAARPEVQPATIDLAARREALKRLTEAVAALAEPYFSVVAYRYYDGFSIAEIAARQGVSQAAVRQRLSRARAQLRGRLERELGSEPRGWLPLLLPLAPLTGGSRWASIELVRYGMGGLVMVKAIAVGTAVKMALLVAVVAALAATTWRVLSEGERAEVVPSVVELSAAPAGMSALDDQGFAIAAAAEPAAVIEAAAVDPVDATTAADDPDDAADAVYDGIADVLDPAAASFLTASPDLVGFNQALLALVRASSVVPGSVSSNPVDGSVQGHLSVENSELTGTFSITAEQAYRVRFETQAAEAMPPESFQRDLSIQFAASDGWATDIVSTVQFHPDTSSPERLESLQAAGESYVGWSLAVSLDGTVGKPLSVRAQEGGQAVVIGWAGDLPPFDEHWANDTSAYDAWLTLLRDQAP